MLNLTLAKARSTILVKNIGALDPCPPTTITNVANLPSAIHCSNVPCSVLDLKCDMQHLIWGGGRERGSKRQVSINKNDCKYFTHITAKAVIFINFVYFFPFCSTIKTIIFHPNIYCTHNIVRTLMESGFVESR